MSNTEDTLREVSAWTRTKGIASDFFEGGLGVVVISGFWYFDLIGPAPLWVLLLYLAAMTAMSHKHVQRWTASRGGVWPQAFFCANILSLIGFLYLISYGPLLLPAALVTMTQYFKTAGPRVWMLTIPLLVVGAIGGELAIAQGLVESRLDEPLVHHIAILMVIITIMCVRLIGINAEALQRAQQDIRRNEERYRALVHNSSDIVAILDDERKFKYLSPAVEQIGVQPESYVGLSLNTHLHPDDSSRLDAAFWSAISTSEDPSRDRSTHCEARFQHPDGTWHWYEVVLLDLRHLSAVDGIVLNARDVSDRRGLETQLRHAQKLESVGRLSAGIAHEINTPIQFIGDNLRFLEEAFQSLSVRAGASQSAVAEDADDDAAFYIEETPRAIRQSQDGVQRVSTIVKAMKAFAHPGQSAAQPEDLNEAIRNTVIIARSEINGVAEVALELAPLPLVPCVLSEINQVLLNLIVNAVHAIADSNKFEQATGCVTLTTRTEENDVLIGVSDNGMGIPVDAREHIFEPFFTTREVGHGTGQGLSMAHSVMEGHGGGIAFETELGVGTTFWLRLPLEKPKSPR